MHESCRHCGLLFAYDTPYSDLIDHVEGHGYFLSGAWTNLTAAAVAYDIEQFLRDHFIRTVLNQPVISGKPLNITVQP